MTASMQPKRKSAAANPARPAKRSTAPKEDEDVVRIGVQLRHYRRLNRLNLKELADRAGCSESLLSKIENDKVQPSIGTLHRLCRVLDIGMSRLIAPLTEGACTIYPPGTRPVLGRNRSGAPDNGSAEVFIPYAEGRLLEGLIELLQPGGHSHGVLSHPGEEAGYVLEGQLELVVADETHLLAPGSTFFFHSNTPHSYRNPGKVTTRVVWVNTPPTF